jgi:hypothetical protein
MSGLEALGIVASVIQIADVGARLSIICQTLHVRAQDQECRCEYKVYFHGRGIDL